MELTCEQKNCTEKAEWYFTWPGNPPAAACTVHKDKAVNLGAAMGFYVHVEPVAS